METNKIYCGDSLQILKTFPDNCVDCCITSPPYWGLRDYQVEGQLGIEKTLEEYTAKIVEVFSEVRRVLKKDGVMFLNLGDSYSSNHITGTKDSDTEWKHGELSKGYMARSGGVSNLSDCLKRRFEEGIFFFGCPDPRGSSTESIHILIYDKRSPDLVFKPFFTARRISIKNGQYDFCEVGGFLNTPVNCWISSSLHFALPDNANTKSFLDIPDYVGIVITTGDLDTDSTFRNSISLTIKNSKTPLPIKITREPITESVASEIIAFNTISFCSGSKGISQVHAINNPVPLLNSSKFFASSLGNFGIRETSEEKFSLTLHNGTDICFVGIRHLYLLSNNGLTPYYIILDKEIKRKNYFQAKQEIGIPFLVRQALMEDGWICRQTIIWHKPNPMPESVTDRCTKAHEYIFLLTKNKKYYFDSNSIKTPTKGNEHDKWARIGRKRYPSKLINGIRNTGYYPMANKRSVWTVNTKPCKEAHFATFPEDLIRPCILAGCPKDGIVLDPFSGAGTTCLVSKKLGRNYVGIELNPDYVKMAENRIRSILF